MTPLRQQMTAALELNGKSPATVEAYVREVALVAKFYRKRPDLISEEELVRYLLHRKNADRLAPASMRRFLDHVLPSGFQKVRHYGFFSPTCAIPLDRIRLLIAHKTGRPLLLDLSAAEPAPGPFCPHCGGRLRVLALQLPADRFRSPPPLANTG